MSDWRPIGSAPTNGTPILGWMPDKFNSGVSHCAVCWLELSAEERRDGYTGANCGWITYKADNGAHFFWPTLWTPIDLPTSDVIAINEARENCIGGVQ